MFKLITVFCGLLIGTLATASELDALRQNCVACHGGIKDGKKVVKGSFDITPLLKDGIQGRHTQDWVAVVEKLR
ncbi:MAG TPA: hypothetical protein EYN72_07685, partial [Dehalococcoidia bacterium]|nr:hypothetical protein [Dehalococcoidia bacterium]